MSASEREKLLMAYLDGQMSATESAAFDESLSDEDRQCLAAELRLEAGIADIIRDDMCCPAATWKRTQCLLRSQCCGTVYRRKLLWGTATLAAAAVLLVAVLGHLALRPAPESLLSLPEKSVAAFSGTSQVERNLDAIQAFLHDRGIDADLESLEATHPVSHHHGELLGARERTYQGDKVVELLYTCCGHPAKVVVARPGTQAAQMLATDVGEDANLRNTVTTQHYVAGVVSAHNAKDLLDFIRPSSA